MNDLLRDPIVNVIHSGIKRSIRILLENECYRAAVVLVYSGMDAMACLGMPEGQREVQPQDFIDWADRYIKFPCKEQLTGTELYGARCGILHAYSPHSQKSRSGQCRILGYIDNSVPEVRYTPSVSTELVLVSVHALAKAFFTGIDSFLIHVYADKNRAKVADKKFNEIYHKFPCQ